MRHIVTERYDGPPEVLSLREIDTPVPKPDEVFVMGHSSRKVVIAIVLQGSSELAS